MCLRSEKFSLVKSVLWFTLWGGGITALKPPSWGPETTSQAKGWSLLTTFLWPGFLQRKCSLLLWLLILFLFWTFCSSINEEMEQPRVSSKVSRWFLAQSQIGHGTAESPSLPSPLRLCLSSAFSENIHQTPGFPPPSFSKRSSLPNPCSPSPLFQWTEALLVTSVFQLLALPMCWPIIKPKSSKAQGIPC